METIWRLEIMGQQINNLQIIRGEKLTELFLQLFSEIIQWVTSDFKIAVAVDSYVWQEDPGCSCRL